MKGSVLERAGRNDAAERFNWVTRAKIQSLMNEHYHRSKAAIDQHLDAYYGDRQGSVFMRAGVTAAASVDLFENEAIKLVGLLAETVKPFSKDARAFQMITDMTNGFLSHIDLVVGRIGPRIDLEMRNLPKSETALAGAGKLWTESRVRVLECLDRHRMDFGLPAKAEPVAKGPTMQDMTPIPSTPQIEQEADAQIEPAPPPEAVEPQAFAGHWHDMWADIAVQLCTGRLRPMSRNDIGDAMWRWFADQGIEAAAATEVEECARRFWQKIEACRGITSSLDRSAVQRELDEGKSPYISSARQSGPLRNGGLVTGDGAMAPGHWSNCYAAAPCDGFFPSEPAGEEVSSASMSYRVSWSMREPPRLPAPGFNLGYGPI